eukprot:g16710.t1
MQRTTGKARAQKKDPKKCQKTRVCTRCLFILQSRALCLRTSILFVAHPASSSQEWELSPESRTASPATKAHEQAETASTLSFMVRHVTLKKWLKRVYLAKLKDCTFTQFQVIVQNMLKCTIPEEALKEEIFLKCPLIPDDDKAA